MKKSLIMVPRIFPSNPAQNELVIQMVDEDENYIGPELTLPIAEFTGGHVFHLDLTDDGVVFVQRQDNT